MRTSGPLAFTLAPLSTGKSALQAPLAITQSPDRLVLAQHPRAALKAVTYGWLFVVVCTVFVGYNDLFTQLPTTLRCDRATGVCTLEQWGGEHPLPPLGQIRGAELVREFHGGRGGEGTVYELMLNLADGSKTEISPMGAQADAVLDEYRASLEAIRTFLGNPSQPSLSTSFIYRASLGAKIRDALAFVFVLVFLAFFLALFATQSYSFSRSGGAVLSSRLFGVAVAKGKLRLDEVVAIRHREDPGMQSISLRLSDGSEVGILTADAAGSGVAQAVLAQLQQILDKPVEGSSAQMP